MFDTVYASRFIRPMKSGKNRPCLIECEREDGEFVEVVVKGSATTIQGRRDLAIEAICGMIAKDLGLPIPEFFAVELDPEFINDIRDQKARTDLSAGDRYAFGSRLLPTGFTMWPGFQVVPENFQQVAAEIFTFDAIVVNGDRRPDNPNCLFSGSEIAIIDHELCFAYELFWKEPWLADGFDSRTGPEKHIFSKAWLKKCPANLDRFKHAWANIDECRVNAYFNALPPTWVFDTNERIRVRSLILEAKLNLDEIINNSLRALR